MTSTEHQKTSLPEKLRRLGGHNFTHRVAVLVSGTALGQLIVAASSPILTRLYSPEDLGLLTVFVGILAPVLSLAALRYEVAIVLPRSDRSAIQLLYLCIAITGLLTIVTGAVVLACGAAITDLLNVPKLAGYLWLFPLSVLAGGIFQSLNYWGIRRKAFGEISRARLTQSVGMVIVQLTLGALSLVPFGLFAGDALSRALGSSRLARDAFKSKARLGGPDWMEIRKVASRFRRFPQFSLGPAAINSLNLQLPALLLSTQFGASPAGFFALGQRLLGAPLNLVATAVGQVFLGDAADIARESVGALASRVRKAVKVLTVVGILVVVPVAMVAPWAFTLIFGPEWAAAGRYLQLLSPLFVTQFVSGPMGVVLDVLERQDLHVLREILRTVLLVAGTFLASLGHDEPETLVLALSISASIGYVIGIILVFRALAQAPSRATHHQGDV